MFQCLTGVSCLSRRRRNSGEDGSKTANDFLRDSKHEGGRKEVGYVGRCFFITFRTGKPVAVYILLDSRRVYIGVRDLPSTRIAQKALTTSIDKYARKI